MGFHYEDAASQWWRRRTLSAKAPYSDSFEMKCPSTSVRRLSGLRCSGLRRGADHPMSVRCKLGCEIGEEGYGCPEKHGCLRQAQVPLFVAT